MTYQERILRMRSVGEQAEEGARHLLLVFLEMGSPRYPEGQGTTFSFKIHFIMCGYSYVCVVVLVCPCVRVSIEARNGCWIPQTGGYRGFGVTCLMWAIGFELSPQD